MNVTDIDHDTEICARIQVWKKLLALAEQ